MGLSGIEPLSPPILSICKGSAILFGVLPIDYRPTLLIRVIKINILK